MVINTETSGAISHLGVATAWGLIVTIMIFAYGRISGAYMPRGSEMQSFVLEFILTFMLMLVILLTSQGRKIDQNFSPIAIGGTVTL